MVLEHVANDAGRLVVPRPILDPYGLGGGDLDVRDVLVGPQRLEDRVRRAKDEDVLDGLLSDVVIDPVDLMLRERAEDHLREGLRRREVVSEGLLDDRAPPRAGVHVGHLGADVALGELLDDRREDPGRDR